MTGVFAELEPEGISFYNEPFTFSITAAQADAFGEGSFSFQITAQNSSATDIDTITVNIALCFAEGTAIETPDGARPGEMLRTGDMIQTADGRVEPVRWIGRQTIKMLFSGPHSQPVRIRTGALGNGLPHSDLTVTADHGMIIDGFVINASALVNGNTIDFVPVTELKESFTVYHIETENHDVILANGAPAETFIDAAGRASFDNYQEYLKLYRSERIIPEMSYPRISSRRLLPNGIKTRLCLIDGSIGAAAPVCA